MKTLKLLIDRNLETYADVTEGVIVTGEERLWAGTHKVTPQMFGYQRKALPESDWPRAQVEALPTIARLAKEGLAIFYTSEELLWESFCASGRTMAGRVGHLFSDVKFEHVPPPVSRSHFSQTVDLFKYVDGESLARWCKDFLLKLDESNPWLAQVKMTEFERQNLANLRRFKEICQHLVTDDHIRDAFHLWTAEVNHLDFFLTCDKRFINKMTQSTRLTLPSSPICPADFLEQIGIERPDPFPIAEGEIRNIFSPPSAPPLPHGRRKERSRWRKK